MERVIVSNPCVGLLAMQVCACSDATDEEILEVANRDTLCVTTTGWVTVLRTVAADDPLLTEEALPVPCDDHPGRTHFLIFC